MSRGGFTLNLNNIIASNLKRLRGERKLSLSALSELCGVSKVMLGQIERGESNPTINTIWKIATGLKVPYTYLIDEPISSSVLIKKEKTIYQCSEDEHYRIYCSFSTCNKRNFELFTAELDTNNSYISNGHGEKTEEYIVVFEGTLTLITEKEEYTLNSGDTLKFDPSKPHTYKNNSKDMIKMTIMNYYPL